MRRAKLIESILIPVIETASLVGIFFIAYHLRTITDGIPLIQLPIPYISPEQFLPFIVSGALLWFMVFASGGLYTHTPGRPLFEEIRMVLWRGILWFIIYIWFVYLSLGFLFSKEIPRLIILYVWILWTIASILIRVWVYLLFSLLYRKNLLEKEKVLILWKGDIEKVEYIEYIRPSSKNTSEILDMIRSRELDRVLTLHYEDTPEVEEIMKLCRIYGIPFAYPKILPALRDISRKDVFIGNILAVETSTISISLWERIMKRIADIVISSILLIVSLPLFLIIAISIKWEDPHGPVIYRNRRIWFWGREFFLYKFRYMYWKYCVKDSYGISEKADEALKYEENLKKKQDTREWPLYKIENDPRKTRVGSIIEKLSLDELPQLYNVLIGNMSLIGPRPHQPREVAQYEEHHYQVLSIKPGITGMAQVYGRDKNSFEDEVAYDRYYIEHYSPLLDLMILMKTFFVVVRRIFE